MDLYGIASLYTGQQWLNTTTVQPAGAAFSPATSWAVSSGTSRAVAGETANMDSQVAVALGAFTAGDKPTALLPTTGNAFISPVKYTGYTAAADWVFSLSGVRGTNSWATTFRWRIRLFKGANASGTGAVEITGGSILTSAFTPSSSPIASTATVAFPRIDFNNEFLFIAVAGEVVTSPAANAGRNINLYAGSLTKFTIPNLNPFSFEMVGGIGL